VRTTYKQKQEALSEKQSMGTHLCAACSRINSRQPYHGPERLRSGNGFITRIFYRHSDSLQHIEISARDHNCDLCYLILQTVSNSDVEISEWEDAGELFDGLDNPEDSESISFDMSVQDAAYFDKTTTSGDINHPDGPVLISITFRNRRRDELESRCCDISVHWTDPNTFERNSTSSLSLLSGLRGE
jgi:hypothetical protein